MKVQSRLETNELTKGFGLHGLMMSFTLSAYAHNPVARKAIKPQAK